MRSQITTTRSADSSVSGASAAVLQRQCACGRHANGSGACDECKKKSMLLERSAISSSAPAVAPPVVHEALRSPGQPLDRDTRSFMEPHFGNDFSAVRVHTDGKAAQSAQAVNAAAYTVGNDVVFGAERFAPHTTPGRRLLAHELTHVVQQGSGRASSMQRETIEIGRPDDDAEREASSVANGLDAMQVSKVGKHVNPAVQRELSGGEKAGLGVGIAFGAIGLGVGIAALAGAFSKKPATGQKGDAKAGEKGDAKSVESAIETFQHAAEKYKKDVGVKTVTLDEAQLQQQLATWRELVERSEGIIDTLPGKDPALKQRLRTAYQDAVQAAVEFASDRLSQAKHATYEKYRDLIAEWALPKAQPKATGDELSQAIPEAEREQLRVVTGSVSFDVDSLFSTETAKITVPLPKGVTARFSSETPKNLQDGLQNVAGTIIPKPLDLNSTMTLALDLEPYGGEYSAYRFTYIEHKPKKGKPTREVLIEDLGSLGVEGSTKARGEVQQSKFNAHNFRRGSGWSNQEFAGALAAIDKIPDAILSPVDGISFARDTASKTDPKAGGDYNPDTHTITMYDRAFPATSTRFGKPGEVSDDTVRSVEHEIGHAVDLLPLRKAWANFEQKKDALKTAFAQYEKPPGSGNYSFPSTEQANFNTLKAQIDAAENALQKTRSESGERYQKNATGTYEMTQGGTGAGSIEFRQAALKDSSKRITKYSDKEWQEYYAESFSFYISDPATLQRLRPNVFAFFNKKHPKQ